MDDPIERLRREAKIAGCDNYTWLNFLLSEDADEITRLRAERDRLREAVSACAAWIDRWTNHVAACEGGTKCICGRTAVLYDASAALNHEQETPQTLLEKVEANARKPVPER